VKWFFFLVLAGISWSVRPLGEGFVVAPAGSALLALGCLMIGGLLAGDLAVRLRLPRLTGYLLLGLAAGPYAVGLESFADARFLNLFEELALGLIALTAGGELRLQSLRRDRRNLAAIFSGHVLLAPVVGGVMWLVLPALMTTTTMHPGERLAAAAIFGVIAVAVSPATTIAVITELRARGAVTSIVLGTTVLKDLLILVLFTWVDVLARGWVTATSPDLAVLGRVCVEIVLSLALGAALGALLGIFMRWVGRYVPLAVLTLALVSVEMAQTAHLEHLLVCMAAGFVVRNVFERESTSFLDALELSSPPIYIVFFALIGGSLDLRVFAVVWAPTLVFVAVRLIAVRLLTTLPAVLAGAEPAVRSYAWMGFVAQAGLSLGLAARLQRELPGFGDHVALVIVGGVVINQLLGPILWSRALRASGEARE
jgi:Kef-type K+ transport system membrane component KefB